MCARLSAYVCVCFTALTGVYVFACSLCFFFWVTSVYGLFCGHPGASVFVLSPFLCPCVCLYLRLYVFLCAHVCLSLSVCMGLSKYTCISVFPCVYISLYLCISLWSACVSVFPLCIFLCVSMPLLIVSL